MARPPRAKARLPAVWPPRWVCPTSTPGCCIERLGGLCWMRAVIRLMRRRRKAAARSLRPADLDRSDLRGPQADAAAASVASIPGVRAALLAFPA